MRPLCCTTCWTPQFVRSEPGSRHSAGQAQSLHAAWVHVSAYGTQRLHCKHVICIKRSLLAYVCAQTHNFNGPVFVSDAREVEDHELRGTSTGKTNLKAT